MRSPFVNPAAGVARVENRNLVNDVIRADGDMPTRMSGRGLGADTERLTTRTRGGPRRRSRRLTAISIGLADEVEFAGVEITRAKSPREVIELLRVLNFNLLLVNAAEADTSIWNMVNIVHRLWPHVRWVLVSADCGEREEILARSLGATCITSDPEVILELAGGKPVAPRTMQME